VAATYLNLRCNPSVIEANSLMREILISLELNGNALLAEKVL
jgi:hypothetical protein